MRPSVLHRTGRGDGHTNGGPLPEQADRRLQQLMDRNNEGLLKDLARDTVESIY